MLECWSILGIMVDSVDILSKIQDLVVNMHSGDENRDILINFRFNFLKKLYNRSGSIAG